MTKSRLPDVLIALCALLSGGVAVSTQVTVEVPDAVTPEPDRNGWIPPPPEAAADLPPVETFALAGPVTSSEGAVVKLWEYAQAVNGGRNMDARRQEIGDCVSFGMAQALRYLQAADIALGRTPLNSFRDVDPPFIYGTSRVNIGQGRLGRSDGSVGRWAALAVQQIGVLAADAEGVPPYTGARARQWGYEGPPEPHYWQAGLHRVKTVAQVQSYEDVRDALANSYPVTIASNVGFNDTQTVRDGKRWGRRSGSWSHQMCLIGVDDQAVSPWTGQPGACYVLNSWGPDAHGAPAGDEPRGGFWVDRQTVETIVRQGDSWAISGFDGFPGRYSPDDFIVFDAPRGDVGVRPDPPLAVPACLHFAGVSPTDASRWGIGGVSLSSLILAHRIRRRWKRAARRPIRHTLA